MHFHPDEGRPVESESPHRKRVRDLVNPPWAVAAAPDDRGAKWRASHHSEDQLRLALRSGDIGIWEWHIESGVVYWSEEAGEIVGAPGLTTTHIDVFRSIVDEADAVELTTAIETALAEAGRFRAEFRIHRLSDGATRWLANEGEVVHDGNGSATAMIGVVRDITAQKELHTVLQASRDAALQRASEVQSWLAGSPAVVWIAHDRECRLVTGSRAAEELLGVARGANMSTNGENNATSHVTVWREGRQLRPEEMPMQRAARGEHVSDVALQLRFTDGREIDLYGSAAPLYGADSQPCGAVGTFVDVSAQHRLECELRLLAEERAQMLLREQRAREMAEAANKAKDHFVALISHELRTPLNAILGYIQLLQNHAASPHDVSAVLDKISRNAQLQAQLIDDLLDVSRALHGTLKLDLRPLPVTNSLMDAIETVRPLAERKNIAMTWRIAEPDAVVVGDDRRLQQVFSNILSNAVKFTPDKGTVRIDVSGNTEAVVVTVTDTGTGIASEFLPRVFDAFAQADHGVETGHGRLGLGLNIARSLIAAHGGTITVASPGVGQGATFRIALPRS